MLFQTCLTLSSLDRVLDVKLDIHTAYLQTYRNQKRRHKATKYNFVWGTDWNYTRYSPPFNSQISFVLNMYILLNNSFFVSQNK